ncbi:aquaporin [Antrihabitans spumae]|uniref:Aquaporin n=1 Tax=Antrihabitans spumae TaxID=3373370 RepID=A0ABW7K5B5_9NOCA
MSPTAQEFVEKEQISEFKKYVAEAIGTFVLLFGGVGTAVLAGNNVTWLGIALAFGLTLLFLMYAIGPISGCHLNPAVTLGNLLLGRISPLVAVFYVVAQLVGGFIAGVVLYAVAQNNPGYDRATKGLGANGWGDHSPSAFSVGDGLIQPGYSVAATIIIEVILTGLLVFVFLASTDQISDVPMAGISIGLTLTVVHLVAIPVDGGSFNPVRSLAVAPYQDGALAQVWVFVVFPLIGGALGALVYGVLYGRSREMRS